MGALARKADHFLLEIMVLRLASSASCTLFPLVLLWRGASAAPLPRPSVVEECACMDPIREDVCYQPVCPPGFYKCCATCKEASCYGSAKMYLSWRGLEECIECEPGDFCPGCDVFHGCPDSTQAYREGPRVSAKGAISISQCESCPTGREASFDRGACMPKYSDVCNSVVVSRCIRNCKASEPKRGKKLTECEKMKCTIYCSKAWSQACLDKVSEYCMFAITTVGNMSGGISAEYGAGAISDCDVDCSVAAQHGASTAGLLLAALVVSIHGVW